MSLFGLGVLLGSRSHSTASAAPGPLPQASFEELLDRDPAAAARAALEQAEGERAHEQLPRLEAVARELPLDTPLARQVEERLRALRVTLDEEALAALESLRTALIELVDAGRLSEARQRLRAFPAAYRRTAAEEGYLELERGLAVVGRP